MSTVEYFLTPQAIRETTGKVYANSVQGNGHFVVHEEKLAEAADFTLGVIKSNYPSLEIPYHSRWGHFKVGTLPRLTTFLNSLSFDDPVEKARVQFDLVIPSVLLDAGAGKDWKYVEEESGETFNRSEGLGVASFYMFTKGCFSSQGKQQADATGLGKVTAEMVGEHFQVSETNPLVGLEGRAELVRSLQGAIEKNPKIFANGRLGGMVDFIIAQADGKNIAASTILNAVISGLGSIWPGRIAIDNVNLGDAWKYSMLNGEIVVFHKLSQWLSYSLFEPLESIGYNIVDQGQLTGLAEYRNGGLFVDLGVIELKDKNLYEQSHSPESDLIVEWRALTVQLLDKIAPLIREKLDFTETEFSLAKVLEGGTWHAGRAIAKEKRDSGEPPIRIKSDGTVF